MDALEILVEVKRLLMAIEGHDEQTIMKLVDDLEDASSMQSAEYYAALEAIDWEIDWLSQENIEENHNG